MAKLEQLSRTEHTSTSGMDITRKFYYEPYEEYKDVTRVLQGTVKKGAGEGALWKRTFPARDTFVKNAYCNEVLTNHAHPDSLAASQFSLSSDVGLAPGEVPAANLIDQLQDVPETLLDGAAGAVITAHYRPVITAWQPEDTGDPGAPPFDPDDPPTEIWDWLDPVFTPGVRFIPWVDGLFVTQNVGGVKIPRPVPDNVATPIGLPVVDLAIRRTLVGELPIETMGQLAGAVNDRDWPDDGPARNGLGKFRKRTLKYETTAVKNMLDADGTRYFELTHHFKWIPTFAAKVFDGQGNPVGPAFITWNHVFMHPSILKFQGPTGWYEVWRSEQPDQRFAALLPIANAILRKSSGLLYDEGDMMELFDLQAK